MADSLHGFAAFLARAGNFSVASSAFEREFPVIGGEESRLETSVKTDDTGKAKPAGAKRVLMPDSHPHEHGAGRRLRGIAMSAGTKRRMAWRKSMLMLLLMCAASGADAAAVNHTAAPVVVEYHRPTDIFNVLDNLSGWLPGYTSSAYRDYWEKHFGLDQADRAALEAYAAFRRRTSKLASDDAAAADDIFAPAATREVDVFSRYFFEASSFEQGIDAAVATQSPGDRAMLRAYFTRFEPRVRRLVDAKSHFGRQRDALEAQLAPPAVANLAGAIRAFFKVEPSPKFVARFVWWPDPDSTQAKARGRYILLHAQPDVAGGAGAMDWAPIVLHEYSHYLSAGRPRNRRKRLTAAFLRRCPAATQLRNPLNALEEPLAIYWGQYRFEHDVRGRELAAGADWYIQPQADRAAKAIAAVFPATGPAPVLDDPALLAAAASACAR